MSGDSYQATYDAVRSRIGSCNPGQILADAMSGAFDISYAKAFIQDRMIAAADDVAAAMTRPSVLFRPRLVESPEAHPQNRWCASYGVPGDGTLVAAIGATPDAAMRAFDLAWLAPKSGIKIT